METRALFKHVCRLSLSDTKYRDIADGNLVVGAVRGVLPGMSDTKYRDIADGNRLIKSAAPPRSASQIPSTAI